VSAGSAGSGTHTVRTGNDNNAGFAYSNYGSSIQAANSRSIALLTIQRAIDLVAAIDLAAYAVTIQLASGRYTDLVQLKSYVGVGPVTIKGDTAAATSYQLQPYSLGLAMANANNDSIEYANHGLLAGTPISLVMYQARPSGFDVNLNTTYYAYNVTTHSFQLVTSPTSTTPVTWTASPNSSGTAVSTIASTTITTSSNHGLVVNQAVMFTATSFPTNISGTTTYYVASVPSNTTFTVAASPSGVAITPGTSFTSLRVTPSVLYASAWTVTSPTAPSGKYVLQGLNFISPTGGISVRPTRCVIDLDTCNFGSATGSFNHVFAEVNCMLTFKNTTTISGGASTCDAFLAADGAYLTSRLGTFNVSASIVLSNFFRATRLGIILADQTTYLNAANVTTGVKFNATINAVIQGPSSSIPGPTSGTTATGGQYIDLA
jgi:hypothetical protein